ncbi:MAG: hypothetical protein JKY84_11205 [Emcibacteraceae bacterium]|nr:hypothetical protein [Emcibacteraceae bacterium]
MSLSEEDYKFLHNLLSEERLKLLVDLTGSVENAVNFHQEIFRLGTSLMGITGIIELALRNSANDCLSEHFGKSDWFLESNAKFKPSEKERRSVNMALNHARRAKYAKLIQSEKRDLINLAYPNNIPEGIKKGKLLNKQLEQIVVSEGKVIAELTINFWKGLYSSRHADLLWKTSLKKTFPNKSINRAEVADSLEIIYQTRNRLAHLEPVYGWRMDRVLGAIEFIIKNLKNKNVSNDSGLVKILRTEIDEIKLKSKEFDKKILQYKDKT